MRHPGNFLLTRSRKRFQEVITVAQKLRTQYSLFLCRVSTHLHEDVDHETLWLALLNEVRHYSSQVPLVKKASGFHDTSFQSFTKCYSYTHKELYTNAVLYDGMAMFQRIVECMTKELTDTFHDDSSSLRLSEEANWIKEKKSRANSRQKTHTHSQDKAKKRTRTKNRSRRGRTRSSVARGARDCTREKANLHLGFYQQTPLMNAVT